MCRKTGIAVAMVTALSLLVVSTVAAADDFFKGKTIRVIVGYAPGGGYDTYTRQIVRHMGKYIPGNPTFVVQNMTGAGSLIAANYTQKRAKRDGTVLGVWNSGFVTMQALGDKKVQIKAKDLGWLGAPVKGNPTCAFMGWSGLTDVKQLMDPKNPIKVGGTRTGSTGVDMPKILNKTIKTNFDVVAGYSGTATTRLAMQAQEVTGSCWGWESMRVTAKAMLDAKGPEKLLPILVHRKIDDPELKNAVVIPELIEKIGGKKHLGTYKAWVGQYEFQRPMVAPPGLPTERLQTLRRAFKRTLEDPEFLKEANEAKLIVDYVSPGDVDEYVNQILGMSPQTKEALGFLVRKKGSS